MRLCEEIYISYFQFWNKLPLSNDMISDIDSVLEAISNSVLFGEIHAGTNGIKVYILNYVYSF